MSRRSSWLRRLLIWAGPVITVLVLVLAGFVYWVLGTTAGTRWALVTAVSVVGGEVSDVQGSVWKGVTVGRLHLAMDAVDVRASRLELQAEWRDLLDRSVHVKTLSADSLSIALSPAPHDTENDTPFAMPELPVSLRIDRLALGHFEFSHDNVPLPLDVAGLDTSVSLDGDSSQLVLRSLALGNDRIRARVDGEFHLLGLGSPWPFEAHIAARAEGVDEDSLLCARQYMAGLPLSETGPECPVDVRLDAQGSLERIALDVQADSQGMQLAAHGTLAPLASFPVEDARVDLVLSDDSALHAQLEWISKDDQGGVSPDGDAAAYDHVRGTLSTTRLDIGGLAGSLLPPAVLTAAGDFDVRVLNKEQLVSADLRLDIADDSVWNGEALAGRVHASVDTANAPAAFTAIDWRTLHADGVDIDVTLGNNHVQAQGDFGASASELALNVDAPRLAGFWPGIPGGLDLTAHITGMPAQHELRLDAEYTPDDARPDRLGQAPASVHLDMAGRWHELSQEAAGEAWEGSIRELSASHAGLSLAVARPTPLRLAPGAAAPDPLWQLGATDLRLALNDKPILDVRHTASSGGPGARWATAGHIDALVVSQALIDDVQRVIRLARPAEEAASPKKDERGGVKINGARDPDDAEITLALDWDLAFEQALAGTLHARRVSGDLMVPADPPFPLGLEALDLDVTAQAGSNGASQLRAELSVATAAMGNIQANAVTRLQASAGGGLRLASPDATRVALKAQIEDLAWVSLFTGDAMEFGGKVNADVTLAGKADGSWDSTGTVRGSDLRIIRIDDGIRLLDGSLSARLENDHVIVEELVFPARLRVEPKEWRTAEWVATNPDAKDGFLRLSGEWRLSDMAGDIDVALHRYPVLQRADRYAMVSGALHIGVQLPALSISGSVTADAGWFDLDMLGGIPTVDGDVVVIRAGEEPKEVDVPMAISMEIDVDLGPRFYLTGYGVNSGLVGKMHISMLDNKLTALGALRTRGGAIEAYGQRLQLRRGTITFQGDITSPILDIEALRTGLAIEAGVRVSGTAKRPRIDLVSYPDVSDIEKLSWLLFGHGPDESGGDMALLLSVGTSFLGDGEPFYRKFGIDEISLQSGELGSAGSILPAESVVSGLNRGTSDLERKFISVSKGVSRGFTFSLRQALSDTGTVGRVSYRLARGLTAELSVGTINGLALVYRWFSRD